MRCLLSILAVAVGLAVSDAVPRLRMTVPGLRPGTAWGMATCIDTGSGNSALTELSTGTDGLFDTPTSGVRKYLDSALGVSDPCPCPSDPHDPICPDVQHVANGAQTVHLLEVNGDVLALDSVRSSISGNARHLGAALEAAAFSADDTPVSVSGNGATSANTTQLHCAVGSLAFVTVMDPATGEGAVVIVDLSSFPPTARRSAALPTLPGSPSSWTLGAACATPGPMDVLLPEDALFVLQRGVASNAADPAVLALNAPAVDATSPFPTPVSWSLGGCPASAGSACAYDGQAPLYLGSLGWRFVRKAGSTPAAQVLNPGSAAVAVPFPTGVHYRPELDAVLYPTSPNPAPWVYLGINAGTAAASEFQNTARPAHYTTFFRWSPETNPTTGTVVPTLGLSAAYSVGASLPAGGAGTIESTIPASPGNSLAALCRRPDTLVPTGICTVQELGASSRVFYLPSPHTSGALALLGAAVNADNRNAEIVTAHVPALGATPFNVTVTGGDNAVSVTYGSGLAVFGDVLLVGLSRFDLPASVAVRHSTVPPQRDAAVSLQAFRSGTASGPQTAVTDFIMLSVTNGGGADNGLLLFGNTAPSGRRTSALLKRDAQLQQDLFGRSVYFNLLPMRQGQNSLTVDSPNAVRVGSGWNSDQSELEEVLGVPQAGAAEQIIIMARAAATNGDAPSRLPGLYSYYSATQSTKPNERTGTSFNAPMPALPTASQLHNALPGYAPPMLPLPRSLSTRGELSCSSGRWAFGWTWTYEHSGDFPVRMWHYWVATNASDAAQYDVNGAELNITGNFDVSPRLIDTGSSYPYPLDAPLDIYAACAADVAGTVTAYESFLSVHTTHFAAAGGPTTTSVRVPCAAGANCTVLSWAPLAWANGRWWFGRRTVAPGGDVTMDIIRVNPGIMLGQVPAWHVTEVNTGSGVESVAPDEGFGAWPPVGVSGGAVLLVRDSGSEQHLIVHRASGIGVSNAGTTRVTGVMTTAGSYGLDTRTPRNPLLRADDSTVAFPCAIAGPIRFPAICTLDTTGTTFTMQAHLLGDAAVPGGLDPVGTTVGGVVLAQRQNPTRPGRYAGTTAYLILANGAVRETDYDFEGATPIAPDVPGQDVIMMETEVDSRTNTPHVFYQSIVASAVVEVPASPSPTPSPSSTPTTTPSVSPSPSPSASSSPSPSASVVVPSASATPGVTARRFTSRISVTGVTCSPQLTDEVLRNIILEAFVRASGIDVSAVGFDVVIVTGCTGRRGRALQAGSNVEADVTVTSQSGNDAVLNDARAAIDSAAADGSLATELQTAAAGAGQSGSFDSATPTVANSEVQDESGGGGGGGGDGGDDIPLIPIIVVVVAVLLVGGVVYCCCCRKSNKPADKPAAADGVGATASAPPAAAGAPAGADGNFQGSNPMKPAAAPASTTA